MNLKNRVIHNETPDSRWYWLVEVTDGNSWTTIGTGYCDTEEEAMEASSVLCLESVVEERQFDRDFGRSLVSRFETSLLKENINSKLTLVDAIDQYFDSISSALERGRLYVALIRLSNILDTPAEEREGYPITSDEQMKPIYNAIADRLSIPRK
jgi:hypothetical protein